MKQSYQVGRSGSQVIESPVPPKSGPKPAVKKGNLRD